MNDAGLLHQPLSLLLKTHPYLHDFFDALSIVPTPADASLKALIAAQPDTLLDRYGLDKASLETQAVEFIRRMELFRQQDRTRVQTVTVKAGYDKAGSPETMDVHLSAGEIVSVVGPTGSGKSRLLADIECMAQADTPSGRKILLDGKPPDPSRRFSGDCRLVAQLSQNMNFVMDLTVEEFLRMHAESRLAEDIPAKIDQTFHAAVSLAGEPFYTETPVTALSGGQSRALMIADVAYLSSSPVVLIDEIENAGVDRQNALSLLVKEEKIVVMATHDPLLALSAHQRIVIRNGGIADVIETCEDEKKTAAWLSGLDEKMARLRERVRQGDRLGLDLFQG